MLEVEPTCQWSTWHKESLIRCVHYFLWVQRQIRGSLYDIDTLQMLGHGIGRYFSFLSSAGRLAMMKNAFQNVWAWGHRPLNDGPNPLKHKPDLCVCVVLSVRL